MSLEDAGISGIEKGSNYNYEFQLYNAEGDLVYYSGNLVLKSECWSAEFKPTVTLPEGLTKLNVVNCADEGLNNWGDGVTEYLFDGKYGKEGDTTKIGGGVPDGQLTVTFELV